MSNTLLYLTEGDWTMLRAKESELRYERDAVVVREGAPTRGIMLLKSGSARVEQMRGGVGITLARMGPGEMFGEMALLEETAASATVIADEPLVVELFERAHVDALLQSDPGFSSRLYRSIAVHLSRRLRERSQLFSQGSAQAVAQMSRAHSPRLGQITSRQLPLPLVNGVEAFKGAMTALEQRGAGPDAQRRVDDACGALLKLLERHTSAEALFEISYSDLGAFRDPAQVASGVGGYVFRQTFSWFMSAATIARAYMRPRGFPEDHETLEMVYDDDPDGDGTAGPLLDRWYLSRPLCRSRREALDRARALLRGIVAEGRHAGRLSVASLASGRGREVIELAAEPASQGLRATCVDLDPEALASGARLAEDLGVTERIVLVHGNVVPSPEGAGAASIGRHHAAHALGLVEYLSDDECVRFLDWAWDALLPGGTLAISTLAPPNPDRAFMEHILEWRVIHRGEGDLAALFARSRFAKAPRFEPLVNGASLFAQVTRD
jgi:extracellular factor (EF) 3-hydroxypalmitic acid methyl ester biosynthesis protein